MFSPTICKHRAQLVPLMAGLALVLTVLPARAAIHLRDSAGPGEQLFGHAISALADVNADNRSEFLVGAPGDGREGTESGSAFFWFGGTDVTEAAARHYYGAAGDQFGYDVAAIGDVNHDGIDDWAVGAPYSDAGGSESGRLYVFFGNADLPASGLASSQADLIIDGAIGGDHFGHAVAAAGDFNNDGKDDFIVGAPYSNLRASSAGAAYIIYGATGGPSVDLADATVLTGQGAGDNFGWAVTGAGNFLGHAEVSVAVGAPRNNTHGGLDAGAVYVFEGSLNAAAPDTSIDFAAGISSATKAYSEYGFALSHAGRWNTDAYDDLVVGAPYCDEGGNERGRLEIIYGGTSPNSLGDSYVNGEAAGDHFGYSVANVHDFSGSSADDVLVGAPHHSGDAAAAGRAYILEGGSTATSAGNLTIFTNEPLKPGTAADDHYGFAVASAGDFDGDGMMDIGVAAPGANLITNTVAGTCRIYDSSGDAVATFISNWQAAWMADGSISLLLDAAVDVFTVQGVHLIRQMNQDNGASMSQATVYHGPLGSQASGFYFDSDGYHFRDEGLDHNPNLEVSYSVEFSLVDGSTIYLNGLAGPIGAPSLVATVTLGAPWPNPFNPGTSLEFSAPRGTHVICRVLDLRGNQVRTLYSGSATGARQDVFWDGRNTLGSSVASGVYLMQLVSPQTVLSRRVVLTK